MDYENLTLSAFFDSNEDAENAAARIAAEGIPRSDIRIVKGADGSAVDTSVHPGGFWDSLAEFFFPDEDRAVYAEGLRRGGYVLTVAVPQAQAVRVTDILDDLGVVDMDERADDWRKTGWDDEAALSDYRSGSPGYVATGSDTLRATSDMVTDLDGDLNRDGKIDVMEERLLIGKRVAQGGNVRVRTHVIEQPVTEDVTLRDERVTIKRTPVNRAADDVTAFRDATISAEEHVEEAVVSKEARVVEEISLEKDVRTRTETVSDTVRKTEVEIEDERRADGFRDKTKTSTTTPSGY